MATVVKDITPGDGGVRCEALVLGAGISGLVAAKCLRDVGIDVVVLERSGDVGGLWRFSERGYGVMRFTHINVSKHNYAFSDFPFPDDTPDFPHNEDMLRYVRNYVKHFKIDSVIRFHTQVNRVQRLGDSWQVETEHVTEDTAGLITATGRTQTYICQFLAIATGHHAKPAIPCLPGQDTFTGKLYHSIQYKDALTNDVIAKRVVVVGIGNSAVDIACDAASVGRCKPVYLSSRSGAWVIPNYIFGHPTDYYACRLFLSLPWRVSTAIFEAILVLLQGRPNRWGLNPRMHVLQTQPTVSATLVHHIQRGQVKVVPDIARLTGNTVQFVDGTHVEADHVILSTGYTVDLPFLPDDVRHAVLDADSNEIKLYKHVFAPDIGASLAFIGFVQPASGGILTMSEMQARWWAELCQGRVKLPSPTTMKEDIAADMTYIRRRWFNSKRHTLQQDPIIYNDQLASFIGAKPVLSEHPMLAWRLLLGSCGAVQWRLQGPGRWSGARDQVCKVPVTELLVVGTGVALLLLLLLVRCGLYLLWGLLLT